MDSIPVKTAIVGVGRWGKNVARELAAETQLAAYASLGSPETAAWTNECIPDAKPMSVADICADKSIEAVVVVTPIASHFDLAHQLLLSGKHILVEKPLAETAHDAHVLVSLAQERNLLLATGYIFLYHPLFPVLQAAVRSAHVIRAEWTWKKYGSFLEDIELNLLTHHLSIATALFGKSQSGSIQRMKGVVSACDRVETRFIYPDFEVLSVIDRASDNRVHELRFWLDNGSEIVWDGQRLFRTENGASVLLAEDTDQPLRREIAAFAHAVRDQSLQLPTKGAFGSYVLELHEQLRA